jgi:hypothetical protein
MSPLPFFDIICTRSYVTPGILLDYKQRSKAILNDCFGSLLYHDALANFLGVFGRDTQLWITINGLGVLSFPKSGLIISPLTRNRFPTSV